jgi:Rrf2 family protein
MQFSVGVEYAFHSLFYLVGLPRGKIVGIKELAQFNRLTESYLSKTFTKLQKAGLVRSSPGTKGGYELARDAEDISFWDIIEAVEGPSQLFQCAEIRQNNVLVEDPSVYSAKNPCLIKTVIAEGEERMRGYLRGKSLKWLHDTVSGDFSEDRKSAIAHWFGA